MLISNLRQVTPNIITAVFRHSETLSDREAVTKIRPISKDESKTAWTGTFALQYADFRTQRHAPDKIRITIVKEASDDNHRVVKFFDKVYPPLTKKYQHNVLPMPRYYDAYYDESSGKAHFITDDISAEFKPSRQGVPPSTRHRDLLIESLAHLHAYWWEHDRLALLENLPTPEALDSKLTMYQATLADFLKYSGRFTSSPHKMILETVATQHPAGYVERISNERGLTVLHGNLAPDNILYAHSQVRVMNWERWHVGLATDDLVNLIAVHWPKQNRGPEEKRVLQHYYNTLVKLGITNYSWDDCWYDYRLSVGRWLAELLGGWTREGMMRGYWKQGEQALDVFEELNVLSLYR